LIGDIVAAAGTALSAIGTGGEISIEQFLRMDPLAVLGASSYEVVEAESVRSPSENLARIREVLNPAVSDIATTFGVSRQSVYLATS
jgi:hypothetical protein